MQILFIIILISNWKVINNIIINNNKILYIISYEQVLKIDSNHSDAWNNKGVALYNLG